MYHEECEQHDRIERRDCKEGAQIGEEPERVDSEYPIVLFKLFAIRLDVFELGKHLFENGFCWNNLERVNLEQDVIDSLSTFWKYYLKEGHQH